MAQKKPVFPGPVAPEQEEITFIVVKFKGGSESMQKGFDAVNKAIGALGPAQPNNQRVIVQRTPAALPPAAAQNGHVIDVEIEEPVTEAEEPEQTAPAAAAPAAPPKPRKPYTFMSDFNLSPAGVPSWKEYAAQKTPQNDSDKCIVAGAWVQTHGGADPCTGRHLFTAFRAMEWKTQADMTQPMRLLKSKKSYFENPSSGKWRLTGIASKRQRKSASKAG